MNELDNAYTRICDAWRQKTIDAEGLSSALDGFDVRFAYNSGRIENPSITYYDTRDVFENGTVRSFSGDTRTLFEIQNQKECWRFLQEAQEHDRALDERLLLETHEVLTHGTYDERRWKRGERPGSYKKHDYVVGAYDAGLPADAVPSAVAELLQEIKAANSNNVLTVGAYFHLVFEEIHPFADGNGRVGRALLNYLLMQNNHPPVIVYDKDKLAYYGAIQAWDENGDIEPMKVFLKAELVKTWGGASAF